MKSFWTIAGVIVLALAGYFILAEKPNNQAGGEPIKIGVVASLTGAGSFYGENVRNGVQMAAEEIYAAGGIDGQPLEIIFEDDQTNPQKTVTAVKKLATLDNVIAVIGPQWDFQVNAALPLAIEYKLPFISPATAFDTLIPSNRSNPYFFATYPPVSGAYEAIGAFLTRTKAKTGVILAVNNDWGVANTVAYQTVADSMGVKVLDIIRLTQTDNNEFRTQVAQIKQMDPDAIFMSINDADAINLVKWHKEFSLRSAVLNNQNFGYLIRAGRLDPKAAEGFYFSDFNNPNAKFIADYNKRYGKDPQITADTAYDTVYILKEAISKGAATKEGMLEGLEKISGFKGVSGMIDFTTAHYPTTKKAVLRHIIGGRIETL